MTEIPMPDAKPPKHGHRFRLIEYTLPGDWTVLVGRNDADNDYLSLTVAQPDDWWFHIRGVPGGHVILKGPPGEDPDRETLKRAAAIAAYHSKAKKAGLVSVSCTRARYVTKPRKNGHRANSQRDCAQGPAVDRDSDAGTRQRRVIGSSEIRCFHRRCCILRQVPSSFFRKL